MKSDIEIARSIKLERVENIARKYDIPTDELECYGKYVAKVPLKLIDEKKVKGTLFVSKNFRKSERDEYYDE